MTTPGHKHGAPFTNPPGSPIHHNTNRAFLKELWSFGKSILGLGMPHLSKHDLPLLPKAQIQQEMIANPNSITWLGHASFFIRLNNQNILIDPFLSNRAASVQPFGAPRLRPPALKAHQLPPIDILLITHAHYDHCDRAALRQLPNKHLIRTLVPLGLGELMRSWGFTNITEMPWHLAISLNNITIVFVPSIHHSRRGLADYNHALWGGYLLLTHNARIYASGDTAYGPVFKKLQKQYGGFHYGLVPIGGYGANNEHRSVHATPEDAVQIGKDMNCQTLIAKHWGALSLTSEPPLEPKHRFLAAAQAAGYNEQQRLVPNLGQTIIIE